MKVPVPALLAAAIFASYTHIALCADESSSTESSYAEKILLMGHDADSSDARIHFFDETRMEVEYLAILKQRDQRAYEYLFSAMEILHGGLKELEEAKKGLRQLADQSLIDVVPIQDYLAEVRAFEQSMTLVEDQIATLALFPSLKDEKKAELSAEIKFDDLKDHYQQQLSRLHHQIDHLQFRLQLPGGVLHLQQGVDLESLRGIQLMSAEQINEMQRQVVRKKAMSTRERNVIDQGINAYTEKALKTFVETFGTSERYRTSSDQDGHQVAINALSEAFWARFYIRAVYGIKIGSIPVQYGKSFFNADYLFSNMKIGSVPVWSEAQLTEARNQAQEAQATLYDDSLSLSHFLRDLSVLMTGFEAEKAAKKLVVDLMRTDLEQELALGRPGGLREVRAAYRQRFYTSAEEKAHYQKRETVVFGDIDEDDPEADLGIIEVGTLQGVIATCISTLEQMEVRLEEASRLQDSLALLLKDDQTIKRRKKRARL